VGARRPGVTRKPQARAICASRAPVNHTFAGGSFLGTTANFMGTLGVKVGPQFDAFWLYGIGGFSVLNETLNINFVPLASSTTSSAARMIS
jgi:hypothetical protein